MENFTNNVPSYVNLKVDFTWLFTAYRHGNLYNTLNEMPKEKVSAMLIDLDFEMQQMNVKESQDAISGAKYKAIIKELKEIKEIFLKNLGDRVEKLGDFK